jgi:hypothetical protein
VLNHKGQKERKGREDDEEEGRLYGSTIFQTFILIRHHSLDATWMPLCHLPSKSSPRAQIFDRHKEHEETQRGLRPQPKGNRFRQTAMVSRRDRRGAEKTTSALRWFLTSATSAPLREFSE